MPAEMLGADPEQLRAFAKDLQGSATALRRVAMTLSALSSSVRWHGPDADHFRRTWGGHRQALGLVSVGLEEASSELNRNAVEQEKASAASSLTASGSAHGPASNAGDTAAAQTLTDKLNAMTPGERTAYLGSDEFKQWVAQNLGGAKLAMDAAADSGLIVKNSEEYANFLSDYWNNRAMERMGIDPAVWDTSKGTTANWETIKKVYDFYGQQFLANPDLQWAGMANMIGPSFAGGFKDMAMMRDIAQRVVSGPVSNIPLKELQMLRVVAAMSDSEIKFYETSMLDMNKEIFLDQARQHMAYEQGGMEEINRLRDSRAIPPETARAWQEISTGDPQQVKKGNTVLLEREQNHIINDDYNIMRSHPVTGEAVTYVVTLAGEPSIPGAKSYPEVFPYKFSVESPGTRDIPFTHVDNPLQFRTEVTTGLPDGNIADQNQRWQLISRDTLPAYQELLAHNPDLAHDIIASDFNDRVEQYRPSNNVVPIVSRIVGGFHAEVHQR
ncbi:WXG100 family type VII secretion target [Arthrobacter sp. GMC3]|uniref:WXG100 family type VII secretion target n=1 Tax=Arthrobacter sp. GMC3 TaxID=2058894 RepID=UPI000CE2C3C6|nr:WXG100 family type VII secretion target [Arthrobacter sp. GMC3]